MQPNNKTERTKAFINFILLFVLSIAVIMTTVFFSIQVPVKQTDELLKKLYEVRKEEKFSYDFLAKMSKIHGMLDSINNTQSPRTELMSDDITNGLRDLNETVSADSGYSKNIYVNAVNIMYDLQFAKKQLRDLTAQSDNINELKRQNSDLTTKLDAAKAQYDLLVTQLNQRSTK